MAKASAWDVGAVPQVLGALLFFWFSPYSATRLSQAVFVSLLFFHCANILTSVPVDSWFVVAFSNVDTPSCCLQCFAGGVACEGVRRAASRSQCAAGSVTLRVSVACGIPQVVRLCCVSDGIQPLNATDFVLSLRSTQHRCSR